jgi:hypothetical protein
MLLGTVSRCAALLVLTGGLASPAFAGDYDTLHVVGTTQLDIHGMVGRSSALLSPDGVRMFHVSRELCLFEIADTSPLPSIKCAESEVRLIDPEDMFWSPDNSRLVVPTYNQAFIRMYDTDIVVLDPSTMSFTNLTDDGLDGTTLSHGPGNLDIAADWIDTDSLVFIRYAFPAEGLNGRKPSALMQLDIGGEPRVLFEPLSKGRAFAYGLDASPDGTRVAYVLDNLDNPDDAGIYLFEPGSKAPRQVAKKAALGDAGIKSTAFSADGRYLAVMRESRDIDVGIMITIIDVETGALIEVTDEGKIGGMAWAPTGSAFAYVTFGNDDPGGLYVVDAPGAPARQLLEGSFASPVCCALRPFTWGANDTMVLTNVADASRAVIVHLAR